MRVLITVKTIVEIACILLLVIVFESIRETIGIPVTVLDFVITPLCLTLMYVVFREWVFKKGGRREPQPIQPSTTWTGYSGRLLAFMLMVAFGAWGVWFGCRNPFLYMSGVKGAGHGYTLAAIGLLLIQLGAIGIWSLRRQRPKGQPSL